MSTQPEWISAQMDGESTPAESEAVERLLEHSDAARRERQESMELSRLMGQLPVENAPPGFGAQVFQAVEREMLLGAPQSPDKPAWSKSLASMPRWAYLCTGLAAGILIVIGGSGFFDRWQGPDSSTDGMLAMAQSSADVESALERTEAGGAQPQFNDDAPSGNDSRRTERLVLESETSKESAGLAGGLPGGLPEAAPGAASKTSAQSMYADDGTVAGTVVASDGADDDQPRFRFLRQLNAAQVGEVVEALKVSEDEVSVVKLTVVDRWESLAQLRVVLSENESELVDPDLSRREVEEQHLLVGVFMEASDEELATVLQEIQKIDNVQELAVAQSLSLADVSRNMIASRSGAMLKTDNALAKNSKPQSGTRPSPPRPGVRKRAVDKSVARAAAKAVAEGNTFGNRPAKIGLPVRFPMLFKSSLLERPARGRRVAAAAPTPTQVPRLTPIAPDSAGLSAKSVEKQKVVVLFVLVAENSQQGSPPGSLNKGRQQKPVECAVDESV